MTSPKQDDVPFEDRVYKVFNQRQSIGVSAGHGGAFRGLYLADSTKKMTERALAQEILSVAKVASLRGKLSMREQMIAAAAETDEHVSRATFELVPDVPTPEEYETLRRETLRY